MDVRFGQPPLHQRTDAGVDHHRRTAQIGLGSPQRAARAALGRFVDEAGYAAPVIVCGRARLRRDVTERRAVGGDSAELLLAVEVANDSHSAKQGDRLNRAASAKLLRSEAAALERMAAFHARFGPVPATPPTDGEEQ